MHVPTNPDGKSREVVRFLPGSSRVQLGVRRYFHDLLCRLESILKRRTRWWVRQRWTTGWSVTYRRRVVRSQRMKLRSIWVVGVVLAGEAGVWGDEPRPLPTTPQVPPLRLTVEPTPRTPGSPYSARIHVPSGERRVSIPREQTASAVHPASDATALSPPWPGSASPSAVRSIIPGSPIKAWLFFYPTTGKALPCFAPRPYVGPISGTFSCTATTGWPGGVEEGYQQGCCGSHASRLRSTSQVKENLVPPKHHPALQDAVVSPSGYRYAQPESPKLYEQLLRSSPPGYSPPEKGFWNTPIRRLSAVPSPSPQ